jgi:cobalt/nickel transport system permease protein
VCGTGIAVLLIGPHGTVVVASIALLLQALFLAHGGLTTLGAGVLSMGVVGAYVAYGTFVVSRPFRVPGWCAAFAAGVFADWATYTVTALQLSLGISNDGSFAPMFGTVLLAFMPTQVPLGLLEGCLAAAVYVFIKKRRPELLLWPPREVAL